MLNKRKRKSKKSKSYSVVNTGAKTRRPPMIKQLPAAEQFRETPASQESVAERPEGMSSPQVPASVSS